MKTRRLVIPVSEAMPGMPVAIDIRNATGGVLVAAGAELTAAVIEGLQRRRIEIVAVDLPETRTDDEIAAEQAAAVARIAHLFHRHGDRPAMRELMAAVRDYRLRELA